MTIAPKKMKTIKKTKIPEEATALTEMTRQMETVSRETVIPVAETIRAGMET
jgi:hypothetical protein